MHDINFILNIIGLEKFINLMSLRKIDNEILIKLPNLDDLNNSRKAFETKCQELENKNNIINKDIPILKKNNESEKINALFDIVKSNNQEIKDLKEKIASCEEEIKHILENCPNIPLLDKNGDAVLPIGDEDANKEIMRFGEIKKFNFTPLSHETIGEKLGVMDFEQTAKMSGSRFVTLKGKVAKLEQALINLMIDSHTKNHGYELVSPPYMVRDNAMYGVGQLPKFSEQSFVVASGPNYGEQKMIDGSDSYRLIPTAEVSVTNLFCNKIIAQKELPIRYVASTPCFRSEIGSAGRDVTGIIRLHQFMKVELVSFVDDSQTNKLLDNIDNLDNFSKNPSDIDCELHRMTRCACIILEKLKLPYRIIMLSTGDTGFSSHITYDIEVWMPSQNKYREISSCSFFGDFQGRRMNGRYKDDESKKNKPLNTLNGSALAIGRTIAAIMENYQNENGDFEIPEALQRYF